MIETERFILRPLNYDQLIKYMQCDNSLEKEFELKESERSISKELMEALEETILPKVADCTKNYLYSTLWTAISKSSNEMVGDICMVGEPNLEGEIEIGYGTYEAFRCKGYMTEIVAGMLLWIKNQPNVKSIIASTEKTNAASYKVLQNNKFIKNGETDSLYTWKLNLT